jgi:hypothetical protein
MREGQSARALGGHAGESNISFDYRTLTAAVASWVGASEQPGFAVTGASR